MKNIIRDKSGFTRLERKGNKFGWGLEPRPSFQTGFTLVELMITVAIIGILAGIAVPNFLSYRNKSKIAACVATCESIRGCQAGYAADHNENLFPLDADLATWANLRSTLNSHGCTLRATAGANSFQTGYTYRSFDTDTDGVADDYYFIFRVAGVPRNLMGCQIEIKCSGLMRQTY